MTLAIICRLRQDNWADDCSDFDVTIDENGVARPNTLTEDDDDRELVASQTFSVTSSNSVTNASKICYFLLYSAL